MTAIAAGMSPAEQRRRPAGRFGRNPSPLSFQKSGRDGSGSEHSEDDAQSQSGVDSAGEDGPGVRSPLLPIFSAEHLDSLPVYNITLLIRAMICNRCETTLAWDQLRVRASLMNGFRDIFRLLLVAVSSGSDDQAVQAPQVSQFLVKPIQQQIKDSHFSKATLYALLANCLQFCKEAGTNLGNSGVSKTRALVCELLAMRLLREFSTLELGLTMRDQAPGPNWNQRARTQTRVARISTLEIAIKAQAKRFLAHPLVIEQLEAIWKGNVVFHHAADSFHRPPVKIIPNQNRGYGSLGVLDERPSLRASPDHLQPAKQRDHCQAVEVVTRRSVTLYDPRQASLLKLSRLRVPRYRQFFSTCSFSVLLALYIIVLHKRQLDICALEVLFWLWSAGFLLDEIVGFNEQGFSLYIMSFWSVFDIGILGLLVCFYLLRLYGMTLPTLDDQKIVADIAYDLLAANAVLLFPRLFSVLDHYRYFSQLLIAFRMMAMDLVAVFILVVVSCSGFFVAFTLSFGEAHDYDAGAVAYTLFQILMGFTPAAWDAWSDYNLLGRMILTLFLFICHFLIVTILITVLTNSFMSIVQNANEEHQFVFAVNTISMVKSDALFSYLAPTNVISWIIAPSRFFISFRAFVHINRGVIKATHFPLLFGIYIYEKLLLRRRLFDKVEMIEAQGRQIVDNSASEMRLNGLSVFRAHPNRVREPSVATFHKDRVLEQVFRGSAPDGTLSETPRGRRQRKSSNLISHWMSEMGPESTSHPPVEQDQGILDRLESRRPVHRRSMMALRRRQGESTRDFTEATMSIASDPEDLLSRETFRAPVRGGLRLPFATPEREEPLSPSADTADDELASDDDDDLVTLDQQNETGPNQTRPVLTRPIRLPRQVQLSAETFPPESSPRPSLAHTFSSSGSSPASHRLASLASTPRRRGMKRSTPTRSRNHTRNASTNTIIYDPQSLRVPAIGSLPKDRTAQQSGRKTPKPAGTSNGQQTPKKAPKAMARPIMPPRTAFKSAPDLAGMLSFATGHDHARRPVSTAFDLASDIGDNKAIGGGFGNTAIPASFATQMDYAQAGMRARKAAKQQEKEEETDRISRLVLARMHSLEAGFGEIIHEVQELRREGATREKIPAGEEGDDATAPIRGPARR